MEIKSLPLILVLGLCLLPGYGLQRTSDSAGSSYGRTNGSPTRGSGLPSVTQSKQEGDMNIVIKVPERLKPVIANIANQFFGGIKPAPVTGGSSGSSNGITSMGSSSHPSSGYGSSSGSGYSGSSGLRPFNGNNGNNPYSSSSGSGYQRPGTASSGRPQGSSYRPTTTSNRPYRPGSDSGSDSVTSESGSDSRPGYGSTGSLGPATWTDVYPDICGLETSTKIIGGVDADPKKWKWMAGLIKGRGGQRSFCGGALITDRHVLTAAHCLTKVTPQDILIRIGEYDFSDSVSDGEDYTISNFKIHPRYNTNNQENDIAIITLKRPVPFDGLIKPVCLPQRNRDYAGQIATVVGWGATSYTGSGSSKLKQVSLPIWPKQDCAAVFNNKVQGKSMICAGLKEGGRDSCQGDSGGPLMVMGPQNRWMIAGIVSWGIKCGSPGYPGVYTQVSDYIDWIQDNIQN